MRSLLMAAFFVACALGSAGQKSHKSKTSDLPAGTLSGNTYVNGALGLSYDFPADWIASADPTEPVRLDSQKPDGLANQCSKVLLELSPSSKVEGRFAPFAVLFAIDPNCLSAPPFPQSSSDGDRLNKVVDKIVKYFGHTSYFSPYGVKAIAVGSPGHMQVTLSGGLTINAIEGHRMPTKEPLKVNTSFCVAESNGYWVGLAYVADDASAEELRKNKISFQATPSP
jgi:hypothetical protein